MLQRIIAVAFLVATLAVSSVLPSLAAHEICFEFDGKLHCMSLPVEEVKFKIPPHREYLGFDFESVYTELEQVVHREARTAPYLGTLLEPGESQWFLVDGMGETIFMLDAKNQILVPLQVPRAGY